MRLFFFALQQVLASNQPLCLRDDLVGINSANPRFLAFHCFDFHLFLLQSPRFDDFAWLSNKVFSRPRPSTRQLSLRQLPSTARLLYRPGTWLVSFHFIYYDEWRTAFWTSSLCRL